MSDSANIHPAHRDLVFSGDELCWGNRTLHEIAEEIGTPFYAYDSSRMAKRVAELRTAFPTELQLHYAMKANPMPDVVAHMVSLVDGLDVASIGELRVALQTDVDPATVSFAGPGKRDSELAEAITTGITINMESEGEMRRIAKLAEAAGIRPDVAIRVNPDFELKSAGMKMGGLPSQFGVDAERVPAMMAEINSLDLNFRGFHVYSGSQNLRAESIQEALEGTTALVLRLAAQSSTPIKFVNLGGGLGIPYFPKDNLLTATDVSDAVHVAVAKLHATLDAPEIVMELGRYLVGEAGIYVTRVTDTKSSRGLKYAICDGGLHHHLAASGNFGQIIRRNYPLVKLNRKHEPSEKVSVVGPLCTPLDLLGDKVELAPLAVGDLVGVLQSGAYGPSASPRGFLTQPDCSEILV